MHSHWRRTVGSLRLWHTWGSFVTNCAMSCSPSLIRTLRSLRYDHAWSQHRQGRYALGICPVHFELCYACVVRRPPLGAGTCQ